MLLNNGFSNAFKYSAHSVLCYGVAASIMYALTTALRKAPCRHRPLPGPLGLGYLALIKCESPTAGGGTRYQSAFCTPSVSAGGSKFSKLSHLRRKRKGKNPKIAATGHTEHQHCKNFVSARSSLEAWRLVFFSFLGTSTNMNKSMMVSS